MDALVEEGRVCAPGGSKCSSRRGTGRGGPCGAAAPLSVASYAVELMICATTAVGRDAIDGLCVARVGRRGRSEGCEWTLWYP
jgi:hypothetical protein